MKKIRRFKCCGILVAFLFATGLVLMPGTSEAGFWSSLRKQFRKCEAKHNIKSASCYEDKLSRQLSAYSDDLFTDNKDLNKKLRSTLKRYHKCKDLADEAYDACTEVRDPYNEKLLKNNKQRKIKRAADKLLRESENLEERCETVDNECAKKRNCYIKEYTESLKSYFSCVSKCQKKQQICLKKVWKIRLKAGKLYSKLPGEDK